MNNFIRIIIVSLCLVIITSATAAGQDDFKISGRMFGDYFSIVNNHNKELEGENSFWIRRVYLTFDKKLTETFSYRLRFEFNAAGDFKSKTKTTPFVKEVYVRWKRNNHNIYFGLSLTPLYVVAERFWRYRAVEKPGIALMKFGPSRDIGLAFQGSFDDNSILSYHLMVANGNSFNSEVGKGKKGYFSLVFRPRAGIVVEAITDIEDRQKGSRRITYKGFTAFESDDFRIGIELSQQKRKTGSGSDYENLEILAIFGAMQMYENVWLFARYDRNFDPNPDGESLAYLPFDQTASSHFINAGVDIKVGPDISIIPNFESIFYDKNEQGIKPGNDFIPRITFFFRFNETR